ncbi:Gx transporter family protein [Ruminococcaceae bacterium OttesenSCG-928-L11]|nr:Gx transporter family protein [Ruminococcaceae bacterium OttesenSCG-928-L11]
MRDKRTGRLVLMALFLTAAWAVGAMERLISFDFAVPGVKLGLGNVVVLTALYLFPFREVLGIALLKCVLVAMTFGSFPSLVYSVSGSLLSLLAMACLLRGLGKRLSPVGVSAAGAVFHNLGQLAAASVVMGTRYVWAYLPVLMVSGIITGVIVGIAVGFLLPRLAKIPLVRDNCPRLRHLLDDGNVV